MRDYKFVFVILHYYTIQDTKKCIESIIKNCKDAEIVIVDNASPNGTGIELKKFYKNYLNIHVILNKTNLGFAKGNNVGFEYAKEKLNADFIIMCNNDTYLIQSDFKGKIIEEFEKSKFDVLGPKIILPNEKINLVNLEKPDLKKLKKQLLILEVKYIFIIIGIQKIISFFKRIFVKESRKSKEMENITESYNKRHENIILHGCFLIFSKKYIDKFNGIDDRTFLYREEELLYIRLKNNNMISVYNPDIQIFHNEDAATNAITKSKRKKQLFIFRNLIKSTKILMKELEKYEYKR